MRALVVDDGDTRSIRELLAGAGFQVYEAAGDREGLEILEDSGPMDLALVDWNLPRAGGPRFVRTVRSRSGFSALRVVMETSRMDTVELLKAARMGVDEHLTRPLTRRKLQEKLARLQSDPV